MQVYVVLFSENKGDDVCDSTIHSVFDDEESARSEVLKMREEQKSPKSYDNYHYYYEEYTVISSKKPILTEVEQQ